MQPQQGPVEMPETRDTSEIDKNNNHNNNGPAESHGGDAQSFVHSPETSHEQNGLDEKSNDGIQSIKERIINTSRLLRILEKQRAENQTTTEKLKELQAQADLLLKEKNIFTKQIANQTMELEKLKKDYHQKEAQFEEVKTDRDRLSKEINQNVQDKEKAESAKRSYEMLCDQLKAQVSELNTGVPIDEKLRKDVVKMKSLADQHKAQAQSNNIALKAEVEAHKATIAKNTSLQRSVTYLEEANAKLAKENSEATQTIETLNEQVFEMNLNHHMEINELKDELDRMKRRMSEHGVPETTDVELPASVDETETEIETPTKRTRTSKKEMDKVKLELAQTRKALKMQTDRSNELQEKLKSVNEEGDILELLKNETLELKESNERLRKEADNAKQLSTSSTAKIHQLEQQVSELQNQVSKAHELRSRAQASLPLPNANTGKRVEADKYAALKADYTLALAENKYLKKAKDILQDKTTDFLIRIDDLEKQLRGTIQQVITSGADTLLDKVTPATVPDRRETSVPVASLPITSRQSGAADAPKEPAQGKKVTAIPASTSDTIVIPARKRKSISNDAEVPEPLRSTPKKARKKAAETDKAAIIPVTDYTKLIKDILQSVLSSSSEDVISLLESARIYTTLKTDLLLHALDAVFADLDTTELVQEDGLVFEEDFGVPEWLTVSVVSNLNDQEKRLIWFLYALCSLSSNTKFYDSLCTWMSKEMISQIANNTAKACRISRIFINLCKAADDLGRANVFCYDILREVTPGYQVILILGNFAHSWSLILKSDSIKKETPLPADQLILRSIQLIVKKLATEHGDDSQISTAIGYLESYCHWQISDDATELVDFLDEITNAIIHPEFQNLKENNLVEYNEHRLNVMKATELVYYHHGDWEFTYQVFISSVVYPLFQNPQFIDFALELIGALGRKALFEESDEKLGLAGLRSEMTKALSIKDSSADEFKHQVSAAIALLNLSNGKPILARPLVQWYRDLSTETKATVPASLSEAIKVISKDAY